METRASLHGTWSGAIRELAATVQYGTYLTGDDIAQILFINDGDTSRPIQNLILDSTYKYMTVTTATGTHSDGYERMFIDAVFSKEYENDSTVEWCQPYRDFGGNYCDPTDYERDMFIYQNQIRVDPTAFDTIYTAIRQSFNPLNTATAVNSIYDYNGDGTAETLAYTSLYSNVDTRLTAASAQTATTQLSWSPGLYLAAEVHVADQATEVAVTSTGTDSSSPSTRAAVFGTGGIYESIALGDFTAQQAVISIIIGDLDAGEGQTRMFDSTYTHVGIASGTQSSFTTISVVDYAKSSEYTTSDTYASCEDSTNTDDIVYIGGAMGNAALGALTVAASIALLQ